MDLFGIDALTGQEQLTYAQETAAFLTDFYSDDTAQFDDLRAVVSNVSASVSVTDQIISMDSFGLDCSEIEPMTAIFTVEIVYSTSDPNNTTSDDVLAYPFSTQEFQQRYILDYLQADGGVFVDVQCVSEIRLPAGANRLPTLPPAAADGVTSLPSKMPSAPLDDIFDVRMSDPTAYERKCNEKLQSVPPESLNEFELSFGYGAEFRSSDEYDDIVDDLETMILDFVSTSLLRCSGDVDAQQSVKLRKRQAGGGGYVAVEGGSSGIVRIRYPQYGQITKMSEYVSVSSLT